MLDLFDLPFIFIGMTLIVCGVLASMEPALLMMGAGMIGMPILLGGSVSVEKGPAPIPEWDKVVARFMAGEIDDFDLDLEGDYIIRGKPRLPSAKPKKKWGPSHHYNWCTCSECLEPRMEELEKSIMAMVNVPPMILGEPAKYSKRLGEAYYNAGSSPLRDSEFIGPIQIRS